MIIIRLTFVFFYFTSRTLTSPKSSSDKIISSLIVMLSGKFRNRIMSCPGIAPFQVIVDHHLQETVSLNKSPHSLNQNSIYLMRRTLCFFSSSRPVVSCVQFNSEFRVQFSSIRIATSTLHNANTNVITQMATILSSSLFLI